MSNKILEVNNLHVYYDVIHALKGISFEVFEGEIVSLIGANGAGKTTTLQAISGLIKPSEGEVKLLDKDILKIVPHKILGEGMAHVPEGRRIFKELTVEENLDLGGFILKNNAEKHKNIQKAFDMFPRLYERRKQLAGTLSGGEQQMLAIGRALMSNPKILIMDEPSMGLAPILVKEIFEIIKRCNDEGMTILLVEQNANMALKISHRAYVLENGKIVLSDDSQNLLGNEEVKKAYLGG